MTPQLCPNRFPNPGWGGGLRGGATATYRAWAQALPDAVELCICQLPGREARFGEPCLTLVAPAVEAAVASLQQLAPFAPRLPVALFGHSLGALLAYETARVLTARDNPRPLHLFVSGHRGPHLPRRRPSLHTRCDAELLVALQLFGGSPASVLANPDLMRLLLPIIRADLAMAESYEHQAGEPLACPVTAFGGESDPEANQDELAAWSHQTTGRFRMRLLPGDHFYLQQPQQEKALLEELGQALQARATAT